VILTLAIGLALTALGIWEAITERRERENADILRSVQSARDAGMWVMVEYRRKRIVRIGFAHEKDGPLVAELDWRTAAQR